MKAYWQYMNEISPDDLYRGLVLGMFTEKLPPLFSMQSFYDYMKKRARSGNLPKPLRTKGVVYDSIRNTGTPRRFGIPEPLSYEILCRLLRSVWPQLKNYFKDRTISHAYKISQIHIRKQSDSDLVFRMTYKSPVKAADHLIPRLRLDKSFFVKADISTCFPSIYTHAITWALITKEVAKQHLAQNIKGYEEKIDDYVRSLRDNETCGILIGPHASNLISEIILTKVDETLYDKGKSVGFEYIRNIDDYECFAKNRRAAECFLAVLKDELSKFNLSINYKKTKIIELPLSKEDTWLQQLRVAQSILPVDRIELRDIAAYLDVLVGIMKTHGNGAVFSYAVKAISNKFLSEEARVYYVKTVLHLAYCYPYLYPYLDEFVFYAFDVETDDVKAMADLMIPHGLEVRNFEEVSYALYFAIKYGFGLERLDLDEIIKTNDCVLLLMAWKYAVERGLKGEEDRLHNLALKLKSQQDYYEFWLFIYEALEANELDARWRSLKRAHISFLANVDAVVPVHTPNHESYPIVWSCRVEDVEGAEDDPVDEIIKAFMRDNSIYAANVLTGQYIKCILGNLIVNSRLRRNVRIHRSGEYYIDKPVFGDSGEAHDPQLLRVILNWMRAKHWIGERRGTKETGGSCFWPKDELLKKFENFNTSRIYRTDENDIVVLKDSDKNIVSPTPESSVKREYEECLTKINALYEQHAFSCRLHGADALNLFTPRLKAVFNDSKWSHGGRLYASATCHGFNYQCIPSDMRRYIRIDGNETVEVDYSCLHPTMLYAQKNLAIDGNAYDFLPDDDKALAKFALLVMLNARRKDSAIGALQKRFNELRAKNGLSHKKLMLRDALVRHSDFEEILNQAAQRHRNIRACFYRGAGIKLQNIESKMALEIVMHFLKKGVPVLPVHDSFVVDRKYRAEIEAYMKIVFAKYNKGFSCKVK